MPRSSHIIGITAALITIGLIWIFLHSKESEPELLPKVVHNQCTNKWAMSTGSLPFYKTHFGFNSNPCSVYPTLFYPIGGRSDKIVSVFLGHDTLRVCDMVDMVRDSFIIVKTVIWDINYAQGNEEQFDDSLSVLAAYNNYLQRVRELNSKDSLEKEGIRRRDSIFKCQHTYK